MGSRGRWLERQWKNTGSEIARAFTMSGMFTRRVRFYVGHGSVRLSMEDEHHRINLIYSDHGEAEADYERFIELATSQPALKPKDRGPARTIEHGYIERHPRGEGF